MKIFKSREYKRAVKIYNEAQKKIAIFTEKKLLYKPNEQGYWHWDLKIQEQEGISLICAKVIGKERI